MTYSNKSGLTVIGVLFPVFTLGFLALRAHQLQQYTRKLGIDDVLIIIAAPLTIGTGVTIAVGAQLGIISGNGSPVTDRADILQLARFEYSFWIVHIATMGVIKLAILFLLRRIFRGRCYWTGFDYANWAIIGSVILWTLIFLLLYVFESGVPIQLGWTTVESVRVRPFDTWAMMTGSAICSWVMDLSILVEPLCMISTLKMGLRRKLQASMVFLCSGLAVIAGLLRMIITIQLTNSSLTDPSIRLLAIDFATYDAKGIVSLLLFWTYIEIGVGFVVACLPTCARYFDTFSISPVVTRLRLFTSVISLSMRSRGSRAGEDGSANRSQPADTLSVPPKSSTSHHSKEEIDLSAVSSKV